jgi:hypothetical protein
VRASRARAFRPAPQARPLSPRSRLPAYKNFRAAIYIAVNNAKELADKATFDREFERASRQLHFDKVYLEVYRNNNFATDEQIARVKGWFEERGVTVAGGITLAAGGEGGQFGTFDYEQPADRAECEKAVRLAAKHFDEVILDDFFFYTSKSPADIAAKGDRSWSQYRLETMRKVSQDLVLGPAKAVNPKVRMIIKYPNWYEHFQGTGYDLEKQSQMFDGIYTGTETRDPVVTDQLSAAVRELFDRPLLRQHPSRGLQRRQGQRRRLGRHLLDPLCRPLRRAAVGHPAGQGAGDHPVQLAADERGQGGRAGRTRPWKDKATSFDWKAMTASRTRARARRATRGPAGAARRAGRWRRSTRTSGLLGQPIGIASYKPYQSSGEDFLHNYLGNIGIPIELSPNFPKGADVALLTQAAAKDPKIVEEIKGNLLAGKTVFITSGLLSAPCKARGSRTSSRCATPAARWPCTTS